MTCFMHILEGHSPQWHRDQQRVGCWPCGLAGDQRQQQQRDGYRCRHTQTVAVVSTAQICPAGSTEHITNLLSNSDFANTAASVGSLVTQYTVNTAPTDPGVAIQTGSRNYGPNVVLQAPFPGDSARSVAVANNWLYNEGNATTGGAAYRFWS